MPVTQFLRQSIRTLNSRRQIGFSYRLMATKALVCGIYDNDQVTSATQKLKESVKQLPALIKAANITKLGKSAVFYGLTEEFASVCVTHLGAKDPGFNALEDFDATRENIRKAVSAGVKSVKDTGVKTIFVDPCGDAEAAAESASLTLWQYDETKTKKCENPKVELYLPGCQAEGWDVHWRRGCVLAEGQNLSRFVMETPANYMTPTKYGELAKEKFGALENCEVIVRDQSWAEEKGMGSYLSVSRGSAEPPRFVEMIYNGGSSDDPPVALVGKGITFDSGGISIKPSAGMDEMRADCGGAACVLGAIFVAAKLRLPINVRGFAALCENMPGGRATKPGDVVTAMNGKTIQVDNTDAEGRLVLADALCYAQTFKPKTIVNMATLTGAICVALGNAASGVYTNCDNLWYQMHKAGQHTGDRVWRMPLFDLYKKQMTECQLADVNNLGSAGREGGSCTAAAFLKEFVDHEHWMHMDIASVMSQKSEIPYLCKGMSGRPTRTVAQYLRNVSSS